MWMVRQLIPLAAVALLAAAASAGAALSPFRVSWEEGPIAAREGEPFRLSLTIRVPDAHYLYASETSVDFASLEGLLVTSVIYPKSVRHEDPYEGKEVEVYRGETTIEIEGKVPQGLKPGEHDLVVRLAFRGCSPKLCYRPEEVEATFRVAVREVVQRESAVQPPPVPKSGRAAPTLPPPREGVWNLLKEPDFGKVLSRGLGPTLAIVFLAGVLTSLTPCVWPVIPLVLLFVGVHPKRRLRDNLLLALALIAGLVLVYAALGTIAVALGKNLGFLYQQRWFLALVVAFFLAMSLAMFGLFDLRLPHRLQQRLHRLGGQGPRGAFLAGMGMGLVASPCAGPVLAALLAYVALQRSFAAGFALLILYGLGMGLFILLLATGFGEIFAKLKSGPWMVWVRRCLGVVLLFPAAFYMMGGLFHFGGSGSSRVPWLSEERQALELARTEGRAVMVEFFAEWCPPCKDLEARFFSRDDIASLASELVPLRVDASVETPSVRALIEKYRVFGWPTVLFLDPEGRPYADLSVSDDRPEAIERAMIEAIRRTKDR